MHERLKKTTGILVYMKITDFEDGVMSSKVLATNSIATYVRWNKVGDLRGKHKAILYLVLILSRAASLVRTFSISLREDPILWIWFEQDTLHMMYTGDKGVKTITSLSTCTQLPYMGTWECFSLKFLMLPTLRQKANYDVFPVRWKQGPVNNNIQPLHSFHIQWDRALVSLLRKNMTVNLERKACNSQNLPAHESRGQFQTFKEVFLNWRSPTQAWNERNYGRKPWRIRETNDLHEQSRM